MKKLCHSNYSEIISVDNLLLAWEEFVKGKRDKRDVQQFGMNLMDNIFSLHSDLANFKYRHGGYKAFKVFDPKPRDIHKASVRDRLVHHAVYRILYPFFDRTFISDSYSCRNKKGTHKALEKFGQYFHKVSFNNTRTCYCLKMDIRKFFANIDHKILIGVLREYIADKECLWLLENIIGSFQSKESVGLPLGNLTSQIFVNIYMNEFDRFVKHELKEKYYIRYADDFMILGGDYYRLVNLIPSIRLFLQGKLKLEIHSKKIYIKTISSGLDFLGYVSFPDHRILRTKTKKRMLTKINQNNLPSYQGLLKHCNSYKLRSQLTSDMENSKDCIAEINENILFVV
jgi:retron-type reverse transcriptase